MTFKKKHIKYASKVAKKYPSITPPRQICNVPHQKVQDYDNNPQNYEQQASQSQDEVDEQQHIQYQNQELIESRTAQNYAKGNEIIRIFCNNKFQDLKTKSLYFFKMVNKICSRKSLKSGIQRNGTYRQYSLNDWVAYSIFAACFQGKLYTREHQIADYFGISYEHWTDLVRYISGHFRKDKQTPLLYKTFMVQKDMEIWILRRVCMLQGLNEIIQNIETMLQQHYGQFHEGRDFNQRLCLIFFIVYRNRMNTSQSKILKKFYSENEQEKNRFKIFDLSYTTIRQRYKMFRSRIRMNTNGDVQLSMI